MPIGIQGDTIAIHFSSSDASTAASIVILDAFGAVRTLAANEILLIDSITANIAASSDASTDITATLFQDWNADGNVDSNETLIVFSASAPIFIADGEGLAVREGFTPKVKGSAGGQIDLHGTGRIIFGGAVGGQYRPSWKEALTPPGTVVAPIVDVKPAVPPTTTPLSS